MTNNQSAKQLLFTWVVKSIVITCCLLGSMAAVNLDVYAASMKNDFQTDSLRTTEAKSNDGPRKHLIQGIVLSATDKEPLPGVTIFIKGTSQGTQSDLEGRFRLETDVATPKLQFTYASMKPLLLPWKGEKEMKVLMEDGVELIDEVVVTGYQRIRKNEMIGSANTVKSEDLFYDGHQSIEQMLQGKLVGTSVLNTSGLVGTAQKVRVRGTSTLLGNTKN